MKKVFLAGFASGLCAALACYHMIQGEYGQAAGSVVVAIAVATLLLST